VARSGLAGGFPEPASRLLADALREEGIDIRMNSRVSRVGVDDRGTTHVHLDDDTLLECDQLLVSTGRKPALDGIGLDRIGLEPDAVEPQPDGRVRGVDGGWLYAVGDAAGKNLFTHQGKYEARACGDAIAARARGTLGEDVQRWSPDAASANEVAVPRVVFTDPELAAVGRSVEECEQVGLKVRAVELAIDVAGASLRADDYQGWAQLVIDEERQVVVGATFAGQDVGEMLHAATIAIVGEVPLSRLWHAVPAYPTMSEVWLRLLEAYGL
jgi:dihydrolipoamide dehydrogenase